MGNSVRKSLTLAQCDTVYNLSGNVTREETFCPPVWEKGLCWPPTRHGSIADIPCPSYMKGADTAKYISRVCGESGAWEPFTANLTAMKPCFSKELLELRVPAVMWPVIRVTGERTRILEMVGLTISMISLIISLIIFSRFRNLWNNRTKIHRNLFIAMGIQVLVRFSVYIDQYIIRREMIPGYTGIENSANLCEFSYILLEYAKTAMFLWMFVEGLYLHNMITVAVFQERLSHSFYYSIGWGCAMVLTVIWAVATYQKFYGVMCWANYNLDRTYWILEGPRLTVIVLNLIFLLNIMRVLVTKLRESNSTEAQQVRKAVRAAIVLLPLLGITNVIQMIYAPMNKGIVVFAIWSYGTSFLTQFQGFFCALIYCFLNGEVQVCLKRYWRSRKRSSGNKERRPSQIISQQAVIQLRDVGKGQPPLDSENNVQNTEKDNRNKRRDPLFDHWSEVDLDSHHTVDIEHIEIPARYFQKHLTDRAPSPGSRLSDS